MTVGYPLTRMDLDNRMGSAVVSLRDAFIDIVSLKALLDDASILPNATLLAAPFAYSQADIDLFRGGFTDLAKLYDISRNVATQAVSNDFWFSAKHLAGLNFH